MIKFEDFIMSLTSSSKKNILSFLKRNKNVLKEISVFELLSVFILLITVFYFKVYGKTSPEQVLVQIKLTSPESYYARNYFEPPFWIFNSIEVGDGLLSFSGEKKIEIISKDWYENTLGDDDTKLKGSGFLIIKVVANCNNTTKVCTYNGQNLIVGNSIEFDLVNTKVFGVIYRTEKDLEYKSKDITIKTLLRGYPNELAEYIPSKKHYLDLNGNPRYSILEKKILPAKVSVPRDNGTIAIGYDPLKKNVELVLKLRVKQYSDGLYFNEEQRVKIAEDVFIQLDELNLEWLNVREIISIEDVE